MKLPAIMDKIVITHWELNVDHAYSPNLFKDSPELESAIIEFGEHSLKQDNIEIFKQEKNVVITEKGCYGAFFESDLEHL